MSGMWCSSSEHRTSRFYQSHKEVKVYKSVVNSGQPAIAGATTNRNFLLIFISANGTIWLFGLRARGAGPAPAQSWASVFYVATTLDKRSLSTLQQTENICITFVQRRPTSSTLIDVVQMLYKCFVGWVGLQEKSGICVADAHHRSGSFPPSGSLVRISIFSGNLSIFITDVGFQ